MYNYDLYIHIVIASTQGHPVDNIFLHENTHQYTKTFIVVPYSPVGFETQVSIPPSSIIGGSGIIDDGSGTLTGEVTAHLLDSSRTELRGQQGVKHSEAQSFSSQGPVTGALSLKATVIDHVKNKGI